MVPVLLEDSMVSPPALPVSLGARMAAARLF
jgi:hypothetical protein